MKRGGSVVYVAILGMLVGGLLTMLTVRISQRRALQGTYANWAKLNLILQQVEKNYVDTIDVQALTDAAVQAALSKLDPHSLYMPPVVLEKSEIELAGKFDGIGIQFNVPNDTAIVLNVIKGGPSEKAGLMQGDRILKVDDRTIAGNRTPQDTMVSLMKGHAGSKVRITVDRSGEAIAFDITRGKIPVKSVDAAFMLNDTTGYIRLSKFSRTTYSEFVSAKDKLLEAGMRTLIFDLRDNTGGYLDQALLLCNHFLPENALIVYMEGLHRARRDFRADGKGDLQNIGLKVLIGEGSASSSEIFAGAMQDNDRGRIYGRRSFGKGLVQEPINFTDGSGVRLTVARFYTPSGRCIQKPYTDDYNYDIYERYIHGEMLDADSVKVDTSKVYYTVGGRKVYGGGGIVPDVFVPLDTTKVAPFFISVTKKAMPMRFASAMFDKYKGRLSSIEDFASLEKFISDLDLEAQFLKFAASGSVIPGKGEWEETKPYLMPQLRALVGRYSKLDDEAFYRFYLEIDETVKAAVED